MAVQRKPVGMDVIEDDSFSLDGFQVVRGEFFAHTYEPSITFVDYKVYVNTACIRMLPEYDHIQILVNPDMKKLAVRPCSDASKDSFRWCSATEKRSPRQITCRIFFAKVFSLMGWNMKDRYKMLGKLIKSRNQLFFVFDLTSPEVIIRTVDEDGKIHSAKDPSYPADWQTQFGLPVAEHDGQLMINIFDDKAVFNLEKDPFATQKKVLIDTIKQKSEEQKNEQFSLLESKLLAGADNRSKERQSQDLQADPAPVG